jgi:interferon gamma-inducible protein 30
MFLLALFFVTAFADCRVKVDLYSESLCPGCQSYSENQLNTALNQIGQIIAFRTFPYGNANEKQNADGTWTYTCQHGVSECDGNMYEDCAIEHNNSTAPNGMWPTWWPFFLCMEKAGTAGDASTAQTCANNNGLDFNVIKTCAGSNPAVGTTDDGNPLMHQTAVLTNNLVPPHQWTPWVVVNGSPLTSAQLDLSLIPIVCNAFKTACAGQTPPSQCNSLWDSKTELSYF